MSNYADEVAILLVTHNNEFETRFCIENLLKNTDGKYRLYIFDYSSDDTELVSYLMNVCETKKGYFRQVSKDTSLTEVYSQMLSIVTQPYAVFFPINTIVNKHWLGELLHHYKCIPNSGCISIKNNIENLNLTSLLFETTDNQEDEMLTVWVNDTHTVRDIVFFSTDKIEKVGRFDSRDDWNGLEMFEFSFRFLGHGYTNYFLKYCNCIKLKMYDEQLFPIITQESRDKLKEHLNILVKKNQYKK